MKNKKIFRTLAALCTCLMLVGGFSVTRLCPGHGPRAYGYPCGGRYQ